MVSSSFLLFLLVSNSLFPRWLLFLFSLLCRPTVELTNGSEHTCGVSYTSGTAYSVLEYSVLASYSVLAYSVLALVTAPELGQEALKE